jgi:hypothetical protein
MLRGLFRAALGQRTEAIWAAAPFALRQIDCPLPIHTTIPGRASDRFSCCTEWEGMNSHYYDLGAN